MTIEVIITLALLLGMAIVFFNLFTGQAENTSSFVEACQVGTCIKETSECLPDGAIRQKDCAYSANGETLEGGCYNGIGPVEPNCVINQETVNQAVEDEPAEGVPQPGEEEPEDNQNQNEDQYKTQEGPPRLELRRGQDLVTPIQNQDTIQKTVDVQTRITMFRRNGDVTCEASIFNENGGYVDTMTLDQNGRYEGRCPNTAEAMDGESAENLFFTFLPGPEHVDGNYRLVTTLKQDGEVVQSSVFPLQIEDET